jgi:hypothetical protein
MNRNTFAAFAVRAMVATASLSLVALPVVATAQATAPAVDPAPLAASLASSAISAESAAKAKALAPDATQAAIVAVLEQTIATSGVEPTVAVAALTLTQSNMQKAGTLTPAIAAAIAEVLAKVQAAIKVQEGPGATGARTGGAPLGAAGGGGGGGGSDYRAA